MIGAAAIGLATLRITLGVMLGRTLGYVAAKRAEVLGGNALIAIGSVILNEHLPVAPSRPAERVAPGQRARRTISYRQGVGVRAF